MSITRIVDAKSLLGFAGRRDVSTALGIGFALYFMYHATQFNFSRVWPLAPIGDAAIRFDISRRIFELGDYPARLEDGSAYSVFPYPPSAVVLFHWLGAGGPVLTMAAWFAAMAVGLATTLRASFAPERQEIRDAWLLIGAIALFVADSPVSWDLRNANSNLVMLGLVLAGYAFIGHHPVAGGVMIGLSIALKLYSGLLLLWLLLSGSWRALLASVATLVLFAVADPVLEFGVAGSVRLYLGWLEQLRIISDPQIHAALAVATTGPPVISLGDAAMALTGAGPLESTTRALVAAMWSIWIATILVYLRQAARSFPVALPSRAALGDWMVLLLAPLPFSPWLEPYHAVPMLPIAMLFVLVALDERASQLDRRIAVAAFLALLLLASQTVNLPFRIRGIVILAQFVVATLALGLLRPRLPAIAAKVSDRVIVRREEGEPSADAGAGGELREQRRLYE
jgi:hypothetical protein